MFSSGPHLPYQEPPGKQQLYLPVESVAHSGHTRRLDVTVVSGRGVAATVVSAALVADTLST